MPYLDLFHYDSFVNTQLKVHDLLAESYASMRALLELMWVKPWGKKSLAKAYLKKLLQILKEAEIMNQKGSDYLLDHQSRLKSPVQGKRRVMDYSNYYLIANGQNNTHLFLEKHSFRLQCLVEMMFSDGLLKHEHRIQNALGFVSQYLSIHQEINKIVLKNLAKIISACEGGSLKDRHAFDVPGSEQFKNLMRYCNRWGSQGS